MSLTLVERLAMWSILKKKYPHTSSVYANYDQRTDANSEGFPICDERITENDRCVIKIIGMHCYVYNVHVWLQKDTDSAALTFVKVSDFNSKY